MLIALPGSALFSVMSIDLGAAAGSPDRIAARGWCTGIRGFSAPAPHPSQRRERSRPHDGEQSHLRERGDQRYGRWSRRMPSRQSPRPVTLVNAPLAFLPVVERLFERRERRPPMQR